MNKVVRDRGKAAVNVPFLSAILTIRAVDYGPAIQTGRGFVGYRRIIQYSVLLAMVRFDRTTCQCALECGADAFGKIAHSPSNPDPRPHLA